MSIHDEIGDLSGSQIHFWPGQRTEEITEASKFSTKRSKLTLDRDVSDLLPEVRAAEIARNLYEGKRFEFNTASYSTAGIRARTAAALCAARQPEGKNDLVGLTGQSHYLAQWALELGYLSHAFDAGATAADLVAWGVDEFVVIQLIWWQRREGESLLQQHIRAIRNGWGLAWLSAAARDSYGNLIRTINRGQAPDWFLESLKVQIEEVRELLTFFGELNLPGGNGETNDVTPLTSEETAKWAEAFAKHVHVVAPDARGRWGSLPAVSLGRGELRGVAEPIARYLEQQGFKPEDVGTKVTEAFFGRVS